MAILGKIVFGAIGSIGGPIGIAIGVALGHQLDKAVNKSNNGMKIETAFYFLTIACMAKIAKADGRISKREIDKINEFFSSWNLEGKELEYAQAIFRAEKDSNTNIEDYLDQYLELTKGKTELAEMLYFTLLNIAKSDGSLTDGEVAILKLIEQRLGLPNGLTQDNIGKELGNRKAAAEILDVSENATKEEIKRAYRQKCMEMHPDKLVSKGLPKEMMQFAETQIDAYTKARNTLLAS